MSLVEMTIDEMTFHENDLHKMTFTKGLESK
jgi:hypothetical protein